MRPDKKESVNFLPGIVLTFLVLLCLDQISKVLAEKFLKNGSGTEMIPGILKLYYLENKGAAFGILKNQTPVFLCLVLALTVFFLYFYKKVPKMKLYAPMIYSGILLLTGAIGNAVDRLFYPGVRDFIYISCIDFPVFNLADIYIVVSCFLLVLLTAFYYKDEDLKFLSGGKK